MESNLFAHLFILLAFSHQRGSIIFSLYFLSTNCLRNENSPLIPIHHQTGIESRLVLLFCFGVCCLPTHQPPPCYRREGKNTCLWILVYSHSIREENEGFFSPLISFKTPSKNIRSCQSPVGSFHLVLCHREKGCKKQNVLSYPVSLLETPVDSLCSLSTLLRY